MTFGLLGDLIETGSHFAGGAIETGHHMLDSTLDRTGMSAFIPPALHEVSDGAQGLLKRGVLDVGQTTGAVLRSFEQRPLHAHDKSLGGNLRSPPGSQRGAQPQTRPKLCKWCKQKPRAGDFEYCSKSCGVEAQREKKAGKRRH
ncbi:hypothetical protein PQX77_015675 [Marasmius sp. AFHP31]|nr:hypothetical protein PQX77_015675 [Marasmius sp. AFHP31]